MFKVIYLNFVLFNNTKRIFSNRTEFNILKDRPIPSMMTIYNICALEATCDWIHIDHIADDKNII